MNILNKKTGKFIEIRTFKQIAYFLKRDDLWQLVCIYFYNMIKNKNADRVLLAEFKQKMGEVADEDKANIISTKEFKERVVKIFELYCIEEYKETLIAIAIGLYERHDYIKWHNRSQKLQ